MDAISEDFHGSVVEAAGGGVERQSPQGLLIAVVRRERHGLEWTLPKGKRRPEESSQQTAAREVLEETGLKPAIVGAGGCTFYSVGTASKIVIYWRMKLTQEPEAFVANDETKELRWLSPQEAMQILSHHEEIDLIRTMFPSTTVNGSNDHLGSYVGRWLFLKLRRKPLQRLLSTIKAYEIELSGRASRSSTLAHNIPFSMAELEQAARQLVRDNWKRDGNAYLRFRGLNCFIYLMRSCKRPQSQCGANPAS